MKKSIYAFLIFIMCGFTTPLKAVEAEEALPVVILGGGVGALTSSVYLQRAGIQTLVLEGSKPGGAITESPVVQNWPGEVAIDGQTLVDKIRNQAEVNGTTFLSHEAIDVDLSSTPYTITSRDVYDHEQIKKIKAKAVIIALGSTPRFLGVPGESGEKGYWTKGVYSCAVCDGFLYKDKTVAVVGGGDSAVIEAEYLSKIAKKVYLVVRKDHFRSVEIKRKEQLVQKDNVEVLYNTEIDQIMGDGDKVTHLDLSTKKKLPIDGVFLAIGATPNSDLFKGQIALDENGYIQRISDQQTSKEGVFAIGDVVDPVYKQAISAAGDGAKAALQAERYLASIEGEQPASAKPSAQPKIVQIANEEGKAIEVESSDQFYREVKDSSTPLVVDLYSPYCGPCRKLSPIVDEMAEKHKGAIRFIKVNVAEYSAITSEYNVYSVPTILYFKNGELAKQATGLNEAKAALDSIGKD